jgi:cell division protein FtsX
MRTKYQPGFPERARKLAEEGLLDEQIARQLGVGTVAFYRYQEQHREFREALKEGKRKPNEEVEAALFKRAVGYETREVTAVPMVQGGESKARVVKVVTKQVPGDVTAQILWLKNRMRERWRDARQIEAQLGRGVPQIPADTSDEDLEVITNNLKRLMPELFDNKQQEGKN